MKNLNSLFLVSVVSGFVGCANQPQQKAIMLENANDKSFELLVNSARDIQRQWGVTSRLSSIKTSEEKQTLDVKRLDDSLRRVIAFPGGYAGTLENLILELSSLSAYDYLKPAGNKPVRGIPIIFNEEYRTIGEYIYDAGIQAGSRATVVLDMKNKTLQIIYEGF